MRGAAPAVACHDPGGAGPRREGCPRESVGATPAFLLEKLCFRRVQIPPFVGSRPLRWAGCSNPPSTQVPRTSHLSANSQRQTVKVNATGRETYRSAEPRRPGAEATPVALSGRESAPSPGNSEGIEGRRQARSPAPAHLAPWRQPTCLVWLQLLRKTEVMEV